MKAGAGLTRMHDLAVTCNKHATGKSLRLECHIPLELTDIGLKGYRQIRQRRIETTELGFRMRLGWRNGSWIYQ